MRSPRVERTLHRTLVIAAVAVTLILSARPIAADAPAGPTHEELCAGTICVRTVPEAKVGDLSLPEATPVPEPVATVDADIGLVRVDTGITHVDQAILWPRIDGEPGTETLTTSPWAR